MKLNRSAVSLFAALAVVAIASQSHFAAPPKDPIRFRADYDEAFVEARERNVPLILGIIQDGEKENERMVTECYENSSYIKLTRMAVNLVGSRGSSDVHGTIEVEVDGRIRKVCKKYGSVTCYEHQDIDLAIFKDYSTDGNIETPHHVIVHPVDRRVLGRADDHIERSALMSLIRRAQSEVGPGFDEETYLEVKDQLAKSAEAVKLEEYGEAFELLSSVLDHKAGGSLMDRAREEFESLIETGRKMLDDAAEHGENREFTEMHVKLEILKNDFRPIKDLYRDVRKLDGKYRRDPESKRAAAALKNEPKAKKLLEKAEKELSLKNYAGAISTLQGVIDTYADTPSGKNAAKILLRLESDEETQQLVAEQRMKADCTRWLRDAKNHERSGRVDLAREALQSIIDTYPDSSYAEDAKTRLTELD